MVISNSQYHETAPFMHIIFYDVRSGVYSDAILPCVINITFNHRRSIYGVLYIIRTGNAFYIINIRSSRYSIYGPFYHYIVITFQKMTVFTFYI
ncbi:hypothetical protein F0726_02339 [Acidithiobacillus caldus]|nr:hypothetical protein F0726_02339 [Acidithiobacillus caldus]